MTVQSTDPGMRILIIVASGWVTLLWLVFLLALIAGNFGGAVLALLLVPFPVGLIWRFRYWVADRRAGVRRGVGLGEMLRYAAATSPPPPPAHSTLPPPLTASWGRPRSRPSIFPRLFTAWIRSLTVMYVFPVRDGWRAYRQT